MARKRKKKNNIILEFIVSILCILGALGYNQYNSMLEDNIKTSQNNINEVSNLEGDLLKVHYIDVGQGDSIFIELPNKESMLIDAGETDNSSKVIRYIQELGYNNINYLVGTHPHTDHIGGLEEVIKNFNIGKIYMPKVIHVSKTYENLLIAISNKELKVTQAKAGVSILDTENLDIDIIAPNKDSYNNLNNYSAVIKLTYGNRKFLFMGDAEVESENEITTDLSADVIKVGHHGSDTSSSISFVKKVKPSYAIISVGTNNQYNHPYTNIVNRWNSVGAKIYRTDLNGNIVITTNGNEFKIQIDRGE